jgi:hypothetical protein
LIIQSKTRSRAFASMFLLSIGLLGASSAMAKDVVIFDWNGTTPAGTGQAIECTAIRSEYFCGSTWRPVRASHNWYTPDNFAEGTLHIRLEIRSKSASHPRLKLIFNNWQYVVPGVVPGNGEEFLPGHLVGPFDIMPGVIRTFSVPVSALTPYKKAGPIDWRFPVTRRGVVFKGPSGPGSVKPAPFSFRYTVVAVSKGSSFPGWDKYIN